MKRLLALDILRGITVAGMIIVNNGYGDTFAPLLHSQWNGCTPCDLVFPFFLFIMGVSCYLSLSKTNFTATKSTVMKIAKRAVLILLVGWAIQWWNLIWKGDWLPFDHLRLLGVLPRIAICYFVVSMIAITVNHKYLKWIVVALLAIYGAILLLGNGYANDETNILVIADRAIFGEAHLYTKAPVDPEGFLSSISAIAHTLIGFLIGRLIKETKDNGDKVQKLFIAGFMLFVAGYLLTYGFEPNKRIWSPSYTLLTTGGATMLLSTLIYIIDIKNGGKQTKWTTFFHVFGVNPLALYVLAEMLEKPIHVLGIGEAYKTCIDVVMPYSYGASLIYALSYMLLIFGVGYVLYRKKIFIKL